MICNCYTSGYSQILLTTSIDASKTKYIIFSAKKKNENPLINGEKITKVHNEKYLGHILDSQLTCIPYIEKICNILNSLQGALKGILRCLPRNVRYTIYNSMVKSRIDYFGFQQLNQIRKNCKLQKTELLKHYFNMII